MQRASLETVQAELPKLLAGLAQQEQLIIVQRGKPVATLTKADLSAARPNIFGCLKGMFDYQEGWDAPEEDFKAYTE